MDSVIGDFRLLLFVKEFIDVVFLWLLGIEIIIKF